MTSRPLTLKREEEEKETGRSLISETKTEGEGAAPLSSVRAFRAPVSSGLDVACCYRGALPAELPHRPSRRPAVPSSCLVSERVSGPGFQTGGGQTAANTLEPLFQPPSGFEYCDSWPRSWGLFCYVCFPVKETRGFFICQREAPPDSPVPPRREIREGLASNSVLPELSRLILSIVRKLPRCSC